MQGVGRAGLVLACLAADPAAAMPADRMFVIEADWRLERYGADIFILRAIIASALPNQRSGGLLLSCQERATQFRFDLPEPFRPTRPDAATGRALLRGYASGVGRAVVFPVTWSRGQVVTMTGSPDARAIAMSKVLDLLAARPASLDILLSDRDGEGRLALATESPVHLVLRSNGPDSNTLTAFKAGCGLGGSALDARVEKGRP